MEIVAPVACSPVSLYADIAAGGHRGGLEVPPPTEQLRPPSLLVEGVRMASKKRGAPARLTDPSLLGYLRRR